MAPPPSPVYSSQGYFTQQILEMPEMRHPKMPRFDIREYDPLLDSACMGPNDWVKMAEDIEQNCEWEGERYPRAWWGH